MIMDTAYKRASVLLSASGRLSYSIAVCLLQAGHSVTLVTEGVAEARDGIGEHLLDSSNEGLNKVGWDHLEIKTEFDYNPRRQLAIAITGEDLCEKKEVIRKLEDHISATSLIAINTESIPLSILQQDCDYPERLIGLNWSEPAHTSFFLEIITNENTNKKLSRDLFRLARTSWNKDPYLVCSDLSIRAKMFSAMVREAFFLVQNGYASIEDIDRACRNDAGYYLPFSGNFRYMDLMGVYAYGLVMKDLNPELSKEASLPDFFKELIRRGGLGMENQEGFYEYEVGDAEHWDKQFREFSFQIREIIQKYPFTYLEGQGSNNKTSLH
jgi:3-hydroxybutyryl-CoA dehydrogenase